MLLLQKILRLVQEVSDVDLKRFSKKLPPFNRREDLEILGVMSLDSQKLCVVLMKNAVAHGKDHVKWERELETLDDSLASKARRKNIDQEHQLAHIEQRLIDDALWGQLKIEFPVALDGGQMCVLEGWRAAVAPKEDEGGDFQILTFRARRFGK